MDIIDCFVRSGPSSGPQALPMAFCAFRKPRTCRTDGNYTSFVILFSDAQFSHDTLHRSVLDLPFARCSPGGEPGSAATYRRASAVGEKTPEIDPRRPPAVGMAVSPLARLAFRIGHRQARNRPSMASCGLWT